MNARRPVRRWQATSTPNESPCRYPMPEQGAAVRRLAIAQMPSGNPQDSWIGVTGPPVTLAPYEHHSLLPSRHTSPRAAPGRALRTLCPLPRLHPRPHVLDQRHQRCGNAADGRQAERQAKAIERKVVLGLPKMPVQARAEIARPRRIERRSAGGLLRWRAAEFWRLQWHTTEFWWLRRLRRQFESPSRTQAMRQPAAKGRVPGRTGRSRWILQHGVRRLSQLHEAPWCHRAIGHSGLEHVDPEHRRHLLAHLSGRSDGLQGLAPDGHGHPDGGFGLRGSRRANPLNSLTH